MSAYGNPNEKAACLYSVIEYGPLSPDTGDSSRGLDKRHAFPPISLASINHPTSPRRPVHRPFQLNENPSVKEREGRNQGRGKERIYIQRDRVTGKWRAAVWGSPVFCSTLYIQIYLNMPML